MANVTITLDTLSARFGEIATRVSDPSPAMRVGGIMGLGEVKDRFDTGRDPDGVPWQPLAMPRVRGGGLPLRDTGIYLASFVSAYGKDFWSVGTNQKRARLLHFGGEVRPINVQWLTIPLTREAIYAGSARNQPGLHFQRSRNNPGNAGLFDVNGVIHWLLVKRVVIPARRQVGVSDALMDRWLQILVNYLRTGELT